MGARQCCPVLWIAGTLGGQRRKLRHRVLIFALRIVALFEQSIDVTETEMRRRNVAADRFAAALLVHEGAVKPFGFAEQLLSELFDLWHVGARTRWIAIGGRQRFVNRAPRQVEVLLGAPALTPRQIPERDCDNQKCRQHCCGPLGAP